MSGDFNDPLSGDDQTRTPGGEVLLAGRYRVIRELGRGGMGTVYLASDEKLNGHEFAVKMPPAVLIRNRKAVEQLRAEALRGMDLAHPNIVTLRGFEECDDGVFLVLDYISGMNLEDLLQERETLSENEVLDLFTPLAEALDYAHREKVVHRDVKPSNILIREDGRPFLADFGIAREMKESLTRITGNRTSGTLPYMSPEQVNGDAPSPAQDIYSFAATMYECLAGHPPFHRGEIAFQIVHNKPPSLPGPPSELKLSIMRGLSKEPRDRPKSCVGLVSGEAPEVSVQTAPDLGTGYEYRPETLTAFQSLVSGSEWSRGSPLRTGSGTKGMLRAVHNKTKLAFVVVPAGSFSMGSTDGGSDEKPVHRVTIRRAFLVCETGCTQAAWKLVMGNNPSKFTGDDRRPVEQVSWDGVKGWLGRAGGSLRLPSEAEWEYACRAGSTGKWCFGDNEHQLTRYAVYSENSNRETKPVADKLPNAWGLYDLHGNVWEWCEDWYGPYGESPTNGTARTTKGGAAYRVYRGGSWVSTATSCRSAYRNWYTPGSRGHRLGFRPARSLP